MNVAELLQKNAKKYSNKPAVIFNDTAISFCQLEENVLKLAKGLSNVGIKYQDKVGVYLPNCPEYIYAYLALFCLGATVVPLDYMLTEEELSTCLNHCEARFLIIKPKDIGMLGRLGRDVNTLENIILVQDKTEGFVDFQDLIVETALKFKEIEIKEEAISLIMYTSGTTGRPKGIVLSYKHLDASVMSTNYFVNWVDKDILACVLPFSHIAGLMSILISISHGVQLILQERFIPLKFLNAIQQYKTSCFYLVPSMYYAILQLKEFEKFDLSSVRFVNVFGAPSSPEILKRFHQYCPKASFLNGWGLTETNGPCAITPLDSENLSSVGRPVPWVEVKIIDDNGKELQKGEIGEIILRSWVVMQGYYKNEEETKEVIRDGWFWTGDLGRFDQEGFLYIVGRKKEMIKVSGELVHASEVESVLAKHPQVREVAVVGIPDKLRGEAIKAVISLKPDSNIKEEDIRYFSKEHLAHFKVPHVVEFRDELPKTRSGKIDKMQLK